MMLLLPTQMENNMEISRKVTVIEGLVSQCIVGRYQLCTPLRMALSLLALTAEKMLQSFTQRENSGQILSCANLDIGSQKCLCLSPWKP